jgi:hypothetical protein
VHDINSIVRLVTRFQTRYSKWHARSRVHFNVHDSVCDTPNGHDTIPIVRLVTQTPISNAGLNDMRAHVPSSTYGKLVITLSTYGNLVTPRQTEQIESGCASCMHAQDEREIFLDCSPRVVPLPLSWKVLNPRSRPISSLVTLCLMRLSAEPGLIPWSFSKRSFADDERQEPSRVGQLGIDTGLIPLSRSKRSPAKD